MYNVTLYQLTGTTVVWIKEIKLEIEVLDPRFVAFAFWNLIRSCRICGSIETLARIIKISAIAKFVT